MIQEAAYYRAERRGFTGGDPVADWLKAEAEIDRLLAQESIAGGSGPSEPGSIEQFEAQLAVLIDDLRQLMEAARQAGVGMDEQVGRIRPFTEEKLEALTRRAPDADQASDEGEAAAEEFDRLLNSIAERR